MRSSLGGNSRTCVVLCINPCESQFDQTLSTLRFGQNANKIRNKVEPKIREDNSDGLKSLLIEYEGKIEQMEAEREEDRSKSENLMAIIEELQESKSVLADQIRRLSKQSEQLKESNLLSRSNEDSSSQTQTFEKRKLGISSQSH